MLFNETLVEMIEESLVGSAAAEPTLGEELGLTATQVAVNELSLDMVPESLGHLFTFDSEAIVPCNPFMARSIAVSVFAVRLSAEGHILPASPSIRNAPYRKESTKGAQGGNWDDYSVVRPDLYVEADFYADEESIISVPSIYRAPYTGKEEERANVSIWLSPANKTSDDFAERHNAAREEFRQRLNILAASAGIATGEQFLICMIGFPYISEPSHSKNDKDSFLWGVKFDGGYLMGARKVAMARNAMPAQLQSLRVGLNTTIGGKSLKERMMAEMTKKQPSASVKPVQHQVVPPQPKAVAPQPKPVVEKPVSPQPVQEPDSAPALKGRMPSAGILQKLAELSKQAPVEEDDEFILLDEPVEIYAEEPEVSEVPIATSRRDPFGNLKRSDSKSECVEYQADEFDTSNPFE